MYPIAPPSVLSKQKEVGSPLIITLERTSETEQWIASIEEALKVESENEDLKRQPRDGDLHCRIDIVKTLLIKLKNEDSFDLWEVYEEIRKEVNSSPILGYMFQVICNELFGE